MSSLVPREILGIAGPIVIAGVAGAAVSYYAEEKVKDLIAKQAWFLPTLTAVGAMGAVYVLGPKLGLRVV